MIDREDVNTPLANAIDDTIIPLNDLAQFFTPKFRNDLAGIRKFATSFR